MSAVFPKGVLTGKEVQDVFNHAKENRYALPAVNVIGNNSINTVLETASELNSPVIIQFSNGGSHFNAGKGLTNNNQLASIKGAIAGAKHVHELAETYSATVILHTDHCERKLLPWIDGLLDASEKHFEAHIEKHRINVEVLLENNVGVSEHPDLMDTIEKELAIIAEYDDKLSMLRKYFCSGRSAGKDVLNG